MPTATFTWSIASMERNLPAGDVYTVHWTLSATRPAEDSAEGAYSAGAYGSVGLPAADPTSPDYVAYDSLTQEMVLEWTKEALGGEEKIAEMETALVAQLDEQSAPTKASGTPWQ